MFVGAYVVIVFLTCALVVMNVRAVVQQFAKDHNTMRLYSYLATLLVMGSLIIGVSGAIVQRVIDSENFLLMDNATAVRYNRR